MRRFISLFFLSVCLLAGVLSEGLFTNKINYVRLGSFENEALVWRTLSSDENETLLILDEVLFLTKMHSKQADFTSFENSDLYKYIHEEFFNTAFSLEEKEGITYINLPESSMLRDEKLGFTSDKSRTFLYSEKAKSQAKYMDGIWLSTPASKGDFMLRTFQDGRIGYSSAESLVGFLPVIKINSSGVTKEFGDGTKANPYILSLTMPEILRKESAERERIEAEIKEKERIEKEEKEREEKRLLALEEAQNKLNELIEKEKNADEADKAEILQEIKLAERAVNDLTTTKVEGFPELNYEGFLKEGEFVQIDEEKGEWRYASPDYRIEIIKHTEIRDKNRPVVYYLADVRIREGAEGFVVVPGQDDFPPDSYKAKLTKQADIAIKHDLVFAINTDYYTYRTNRSDLRCGIEIRNGRIIVDEPLEQEKNSYPPYHHLMVMKDGSFELSKPGELSAQEMIDKGVWHNFTFGPWLIDKGEINESYIGRYGNHFEARVAIGQVNTRHFVIIVSEGRQKQSQGLYCEESAYILKEKGCVTAFNLDGGQTSFIGFMGKQLNRMYALPNPYVSRPQSEVMGIGRTNWMKENGR